MSKDIIRDIDGNEYKTVKIGDQLWMAENLNVGRFRNGDPIPEAKSEKDWQFAGENGKPAWCYYDNNVEYGKLYGKLYNLYAMKDIRGLSPEGWYVPSDDDWKQLEINIGMSPNKTDAAYFRGTCEGGILKSTRTYPDSHPRWSTPNEGATNESGFSGLPGGARESGKFGSFDKIGEFGAWWTSSEQFYGIAWYRGLDHRTNLIYKHFAPWRLGLSIRCIMEKNIRE